MSMAMSTFSERLFFGSATLASSGFSALGAILNVGETRWLYVTLASSSLMSGFLALMFKRSDETIRLVVGRCGFAVLGGVMASKPVVHSFGMAAAADADVISLAFVSSLVCIVTFFVGFVMLHSLEKAAPSLAAKWFKKLTE